MDDQSLRDHILRIIHIVRARQLQAVSLLCLLVAFITQHRLSTTRHANRPTRDIILQRRNVREEMLRDLSNSGKCRELIRMSERAYMKLCNILKHDAGLRPTQRMSVEEEVARFLHIVGNDMRNRLASWIYRRSRSTTSRSFHRVLRAIISLEGHYIQQPKGDIVPKEIQEKKRFYPFFKDCIDSKPSAAALKTRKVTNYHEMLKLFAKDRASGAQAETAKERSARLQKEDSINTESPPKEDEFLAANDVTFESQCNPDDNVHVVDLTSSLPEHSSSAKKCKSRKRKVEQEDNVLSSLITSGFGCVANAIAEGNKMIHESNKILERVHHCEYAGEEILEELESMGLDPREEVMAYKYLVENQAKARSLFSCPPNKRLRLLRGMMGLGN